MTGFFTKLIYRIRSFRDAEGQFFELEYFNGYKWLYAGEFNSPEEAKKGMDKRELSLSIGETVML